MCVYLGTKFQVSSIILTSFRQVEGGGGDFVGSIHGLSLIIVSTMY